MRIVDAESLRTALPMSEAIAAVRWAYTAASTGRAVLPQRIHLSPNGGSDITLVMPAFVEASTDGCFTNSLAVKTVSVFPGNRALGVATILGGVMVLDPTTGACIGLVDGASLTAIRTGAGSAVATDKLAREEASTVAIFGNGAQAATQLEGICAVRSIRTGWIFGRDPAKVEAFCARLAGRFGITADLRIAETPGQALADADIVCTATGSTSALFQDDELKPGAHINAIGAYRPDMTEIPATTMLRARIFVDHCRSSLSEAGDLVQPIASGVFDEAHIVGEIGALLAGERIGRQDRRQITLFKSVGMAAQDAVCATVAVRNAEQNQLGVSLQWN